MSVLRTLARKASSEPGHVPTCPGTSLLAVTSLFSHLAALQPWTQGGQVLLCRQGEALATSGRGAGPLFPTGCWHGGGCQLLLPSLAVGGGVFHEAGPARASFEPDESCVGQG